MCREGYTGSRALGDGGMPQGVWADVAGDAGDSGDPQHHPVDVSAVDRFAGHRSQRQGDAWPLSAAGFQDTEHRGGQRHGGGFGALADQVHTR